MAKKEVKYQMKSKISIIFLVPIMLTCMMTACMSLNNKTSSGSLEDQDVATSPSYNQIGESAYESESGRSNKDNESLENVWQFDTPENHGVSGTILTELFNTIKEQDIRSVVIVKDGDVISEYYKDGYDKNSRFPVFSCTKSMISALIGIAIDRGYIDGVDTKISEYFPQIAGSEDYKGDITIKNLLTHTSGIDWPEIGSSTLFDEFENSKNWVEFVLARPMAAKPGSVFNYNSGGVHLLSAIIQQATGETAESFASKNIFQPLEMDSVVWLADPQGISAGGFGISMTSRDMAKFGQLYLNNGKWHGEQIVPEAWVSESTKQQLSINGDPNQYGYQWWINKFGDDNPYYGYFAVGFAGQYIFVVPEINLVTVITSWYPTQSTAFIETYFNDYVLNACLLARNNK